MVMNLKELPKLNQDGADKEGIYSIIKTALNLFLMWPFLFFSVTYMPFITIFGHPTYFFFLHSF